MWALTGQSTSRLETMGPGCVRVCGPAGLSSFEHQANLTRNPQTQICISILPKMNGEFVLIAIVWVKWSEATIKFSTFSNRYQCKLYDE